MNIALFLQMAAEACPERIALTHDDRHFSYLDIYQAAQRAAAIFSASDVQTVALLDVSSPAVPIALMGAAMAGKPYVPLNYRLSESQLTPLVSRIAPTYLIHGVEQPQTAFNEGTAQTTTDFLNRVLSGDINETPWKEDASAVAVQLFTSGTTGTPKAAILRHEHLVSYILGSVEFMGALEDEGTLVTVPPYHIAGISAVMSNIYACRRIIQLPDFAADRWLSLCEREAVTSAFVVPTMLSRIIEHLSERGQDAAHLPLRSIAYGGGKMPVPVIQKALQHFPKVDFTNAYGLTETSSTITLLTPDDHRAAMEAADPLVTARLGSVGKPLPTVDIEIRDEEGQLLEQGQAGEIYVRGPQVSGEYEGRSVLDAEGWFPTRDAGFLDDGGYLFLSGRADDVIVRGGENISPGEIEDLLHERIEVSDVAVVSMPSEEWGEAVALAMVLAPGHSLTEEDVKAHIRTHLRSSRVPEAVHFCSELPYTETGKLLRREVKTWFLGNADA